VESIEDLCDVLPDSTVIIRSHGVPPETRALLEKSGANICDATCPKVSRVQKLVKKYYDLGHDIVIVGNPEHTEVRGLAGYADYKCKIVQSEEEAGRLDNLRSPVIIGQTTINEEFYDSVASVVKRNYPEAIVLDTLCDSTSTRQQEIAELAVDTDAIVVVGGKNSSNTKQLFEVARKTGVACFWVETADEISTEDFKNFSSVAVTAGASTPHWIVSRVVEKLERLGKKIKPIWEWEPLKNFGYAIVQSGFMAGIAASMLSLCVPLFANTGFNPAITLSAGFFIFAIHALYNLKDWMGLALVDPARILFYRRNRKIILSAITFALLLSVSLALLAGIIPTIIMISGVILFVIVHGIRRIPKFGFLKGFSSLWEIPGAKDILHSAGWFLAVGIIPVFAFNIPIVVAISVLLWVASIAILRAALFSINELETDRITGKESLATILGEKAESTIAITTIFLCAGITIFGVSAGYFNNLVLFEIAPLLYLLSLMLFKKKLGIRRGTWMELAIDLGFVLMGLIAVILRLLTAP